MENFATSKACSLLAVPRAGRVERQAVVCPAQPVLSPGTEPAPRACPAPQGHPSGLLGVPAAPGARLSCAESHRHHPPTRDPASSPSLMLGGGCCCCCCITCSLKPFPPDPQHSFLAPACAWDTAAATITDSIKTFKKRIPNTYPTLPTPPQIDERGL